MYSAGIGSRLVMFKGANGNIVWFHLAYRTQETPPLRELVLKSTTSSGSSASQRKFLFKSRLTKDSMLELEEWPTTVVTVIGMIATIIAGTITTYYMML